ncbi:MAG: hypothetical protein EOM83_07445 [Clostridia bacterium]|nr:hypothetical protein [Clostridia bacterium]
MKKITFLFAFLSVAFFANAQSNNEEVDFYQSIFGMEKKAVVADFLNLEESNPFWALYDEYEAERKELGKDRILTLAFYANNYDKMDDAKNDEIIKSMISLRNANDKLIDKYYKKIKKASGSKVAAQFFQLESYFLSEIRTNIMESIPFIGDFSN